MKSYKENWKKLIGIGVVALAALLVLIGSRSTSPTLL